MRKVCINLTKRQDRKIHMDRNIAGKFISLGSDPLEYFKAVDGFTTNWSMPIQGVPFKARPGWRDPYQHRHITKGEMGCFASHFMVWIEALRTNEPMIVFEDDVVIDWDKWDEARYLEIMKKSECDILLLGYNENEPDKVSPHTSEEDLVYPMYPYNTHAYVISPKAVEWLTKCECNKDVIPADEWFTEMMHKHGKTIWALKDDVAGQVSRDDLSSDVEPTTDRHWHIDFTSHHITVGTDYKKTKKLVDSVQHWGYNVKNIGAGVEWHGTDMSGPGGGQKVNLLRTALLDMKPNDVVMFTDAYDVFVNASLSDITRRYLDMKADIVFAAEKTIWPDDSIADQFPEADTAYKYLNSGCFIGTVKAIQELIRPDVLDNDDDQLYYQKRYLNIGFGDARPHNLRIALDTEQYIFATYDNCVAINNKQIYNPETYCYATVFHGNGGDEAKTHFNNLYKLLYGKEEGQGLFINAMGAFDYLDTDMIVCDFMTEAQCNQLIEIADGHGGWAPLPDDKFPAYEIRLKELGLWEECQKHWEEQIYPIVEKYWWPLQMYGLRDAFVMRYSVDTQKKLAMHNDASLVTGSVKLNDDYEGGVLNFPRQAINNIDVPVGKMILFPGMVTHGHECTELTDGVKYSLTMWSSRYPGDEN